MIDSTVYIKKKDNTGIEIICQDFDFVVEMREKFSFFADGYKFHPAYKAKAWDGKIRLLKQDNTMPFGLFHEVMKFCKLMNRPFKLDPKIKRWNLPKEKFENFVKSLNVHVDGDSIDPYEYQIDASHHALEVQRCILLSPTSSGKSLIQYLIVRLLERMSEGTTMLVVVPTVGLVSQMIGDFCDYSSEIDWDGEKMIHGIKGGVKKETSKHIIVSTYQSLREVPDEWFEQFDVCMVDEVHTATAKSVSRVVEACKNACYKIGLTGTMDETKANKMTLLGLFGPVYTVITTKELMDMNRVANLDIKVAMLVHPEAERKHLRSSPRGPKDQKKGKPKRKKASYQEEMTHIVNSEKRNKFIMRLASKLQGNTIIMINEIEHGENLVKWLKDGLPHKNIYLYTGSVGDVEREQIRKSMELQDGAIIVGSLGTISTGISIKRLHNLILAHPNKSRIKVLQSIGRLLRKSKFGNNVTFYDIVDDFRIGAYENYVYGHGLKRYEYYCEQQFEVDIIDVNLEN